MRKTAYCCVRSLRPCTASMQMLCAHWCTSQLPTRAYIPSNFVFFAVTSVTHKEKKVWLGGTNSDERRRKVENKLAFVVL